MRMAVNPYDQCPCGSGKKFKWCCQDIYTDIDAAFEQAAAGQHEAAIRKLDDVVAAHPGNPEAHGRRAQLLASLGRIDDPEAALERAIRSCQGLAGARVRLQSSERARGATVEADEDRLCQVFINLISNAIKYNTNPAPQVTIRSALRGGAYEVEVADNGPGIRAEERDRIFSKFMRGWAYLQTGASGAGLGLAISRQIMRRLGGTLEVVPGDGRGACFRVTLPARAPAAA